jgi:hypothetical protein
MFKGKQLAHSTSKIIKLDLVPMSKKPKIASKLSLSIKKEIILYTLHLPMSPIVGMPPPMPSLILYMQEWDLSNHFTLYLFIY